MCFVFLLFISISTSSQHCGIVTKRAMRLFTCTIYKVEWCDVPFPCCPVAGNVFDFECKIFECGGTEVDCAGAMAALDLGSRTVTDMNATHEVRTSGIKDLIKDGIKKTIRKGIQEMLDHRTLTADDAVGLGVVEGNLTDS